MIRQTLCSLAPAAFPLLRNPSQARSSCASTECSEPYSTNNKQTTLSRPVDNKTLSCSCAAYMPQHEIYRGSGGNAPRILHLQIRLQPSDLCTSVETNPGLNVTGEENDPVQESNQGSEVSSEAHYL
jgi:hypothetical protein